MYFCFDGIFPKLTILHQSTKSSIFIIFMPIHFYEKQKNKKHKILNFTIFMPIHFYGKKNTANILRYYNGFQKENIGKKKKEWVWDRFTLGAIRDEVDYQTKTQFRKERRSKFPKKSNIFTQFNLTKP